jgi:predicted RNase H-like nuclease (RuvC/YqgF family)
MRKVILSVAAVASALAVASPAAAQYYPAPPQGPVHGYGYGNNNYGHFRNLQVRIDNLQRQINHLDRRDILRDREAERLRDQSREIERQLRYSARNGLSPYEANAVERRIARLEQRIYRDAHDGNRWGRNVDRRDWRDRDRDGRNDRWEDDRGRDHD